MQAVYAIAKFTLLPQCRKIICKFHKAAILTL